MIDGLTDDRLVLSVMGPHAGETPEAIFSRKIRDVSVAERTFWLYRSPRARPDLVRAHAARCVIFLAPSMVGGARPTIVAARATSFSPDRSRWSPLPEEISPVTGNLRGEAYAFVFSSLCLNSTSISVDLWQYATEGGPVRFRLGASTLLATRTSTATHPARAKSRFRRVLAIGLLATPPAVWIR